MIDILEGSVMQFEKWIIKEMFLISFSFQKNVVFWPHAL